MRVLIHLGPPGATPCKSACPSLDRVLEAGAGFALDQHRNEVAHAGAFEVLARLVHSIHDPLSWDVREPGGEAVDDVLCGLVFVNELAGHSAMMRSGCGVVKVTGTGCSSPHTSQRRKLARCRTTRPDQPRRSK